MKRAKPETDARALLVRALTRKTFGIVDAVRIVAAGALHIGDAMERIADGAERQRAAFDRVKAASRVRSDSTAGDK